MTRVHLRWLAPVILLVIGIVVVLAGSSTTVDIVGGATSPSP